MKSYRAKIQIGKNGITQGLIESISLALRYHKQVRVSCLKSSGRDRNSIRQIAEELRNKLPLELKCKILGFTILLIKSRG